MAKITYEDKEFLNKNENIADKNKVNDTDLNQIKEVVNGNDDKIGNLSDLNTADKSSLVNSINEVNQKTKIENLLNTPIQAPNNANNYNYGNLNDNYNNYDLLLVRVASNSGGGEGTWGIVNSKYTSDRIYLYAMSTYYAHLIIQCANNNQIGIRTIDSRGWALSGLYITSVYGIRF